MFRGKRTYRFLKDREHHHKECLENFSDKEDFIVQFSSTKGIAYIKFASCDSFYPWYKDIPEYQKSFFEVIRDGHQKFRVDIDEKVENINAVVSRVVKILEELGIEEPKIITFDIETSYHLVLSNYSFPSYKACKSIATIMSNTIGMDVGVYGKTQHFRIEGCTKYGERRWKRRTGDPVDVDNFNEGIISDTRNTRTVDLPDIAPIPRRITGSMEHAVPRNFKIRHRIGRMVVLDRIRPSYCEQCNRVHDKENAYMVGNNFYCRRWTCENP